MKTYSYPVAVISAGRAILKTTVEAVNRANAVRMALVRADALGLTVAVPAGATLGSVLRAGVPVLVGRGSFCRNA